MQDLEDLIHLFSTVIQLLDYHFKIAIYLSDSKPLLQAATQPYPMPPVSSHVPSQAPSWSKNRVKLN